MEEKFNLLDKVIIAVDGYLSKPGTAFAFGIVITLTMFYFLIFSPAINQNEKTIKSLEKKLDRQDSTYASRIRQLQEEQAEVKASCFDDMVRYNDLFQSLKEDSKKSATITKEVADRQKKILRN